MTKNLTQYLVASLLAAVFLRGVGIIGHSKADEKREREEEEMFEH